MDSRSSSSEKAMAEDGEVYEQFALIRAGILGLVFLLATGGNLFFLGTLWKKRKRNTRTQLFLLHLCLADLVVAFFQVLPQFSIEITHRFRGTDFLCRSVKYLQVVGMFASAYMIVAMTIDRYHAVCKPMVSFLNGSFRRYLSIGAAWLLSLAFSAPQLFIFSLQEVEKNQYDCWATFIEPWGSRVYISWITLSVFGTPAVILLYCQIRICTTIYFNMKRKALQAGRADTRGVSNAMLKTVKMTFVIIMAYTVCWSPFFVAQLWSAWSPSSAPTKGWCGEKQNKTKCPQTFTKCFCVADPYDISLFQVPCLPSSCCWPVSTAAPTHGFISTTAKLHTTQTSHTLSC